MKLAIIGYGKLGKAIGHAWEKAGGEIVAQISSSDSWNANDLNADIAVECTTPSSAVKNLTKCIEAGLPVVTGTTGWLDDIQIIEDLAKSKKTCVFYATNFSIGVHLTNKMASQMTQLLKSFDEYSPMITESHHIHKLDKPSGTAITLSEVVKKAGEIENINIDSKREGEIIGTHELIWESEIDQITLKHHAKSRQGFANGAVKSLFWLYEKNKNGDYGVFTMEHLIDTIS